MGTALYQGAFVLFTPYPNKIINSRQLSQKLYSEAPDYEIAIRLGKDVRHLWFALRDWHGGDSEAFFGGLGAWAEKRMEELGVS